MNIPNNVDAFAKYINDSNEKNFTHFLSIKKETNYLNFASLISSNFMKFFDNFVLGLEMRILLFNIFNEVEQNIPTQIQATNKLLERMASFEISKRPTPKEAYDEMYIDPAYAFCAKNNFKEELSKLVVCDSYLQSGSVLSLLRNMFSERPPINGGDEKIWIESYCKARRNWLANHSRTVLHNTVYRMDFMLDRIKKGDWSLSQSPFVANDVKILS
jgi:hypothetical protein